MKTCVKCNGPIPTPVLGDDPHERCALCGDEPATPPEVLALLKVAVGPLVQLRDYLERSEGEPTESWEWDAFVALDRALEEIDSAVRTLEQPEVEGPCRFCGDAGPHEGWCCEPCFDVLAGAYAWHLPLEEQRRLVAAAAEDDGEGSVTNEDVIRWVKRWRPDLLPLIEGPEDGEQ